MQGRMIFVLMIALVVCLTALAADPATPATPGPDVLKTRPSQSGEPTVVEVGVLVFDVDEVDDVNQRFGIDLFIVGRWHDPQLAVPENERTGQLRFIPPDQVWMPKILVLNDRGLTPHLRAGVEVDDLGNVKYQNRMTGELAANLEFREFPFDVQRLPIDLVSYEHTTDELRFSPNSAIASQTDDFSIEGWHLAPLEPEVGTFQPLPDAAELPRLTFVLEATRDSDYYVLTMLVPMSLIIFMAWTVFWLQPDIVPPRISISTAAIFSLLALGVSIRLSLPKVSYFTRADIFVLGCTLMVFIALGVAVIGSRWAKSGRMAQALRVNAIARWIYMMLFTLLAYLAIIN